VGLAAAIQRHRLGIQRKLLRLQQQAALDQQRADFAHDMHDDIGATLSQIAILSEVAKKSLDNPQRAEQHIQRISQTARSVIDNLSELVWAVNPGNDTLAILQPQCRRLAQHRLPPV
jgi:signal transduction histidine kinase